MTKYQVEPVDIEIPFYENELIVSKTDLKGRLTYANQVFCRVAEMSTADVIGQPHSIIRHPDMPRAVFQLMWQVIQGGEEIFAYVKNMSKTGKYYWVIAHVTPSYDAAGRISGYHSNRRKPSVKGINAAKALYAQLLAEEQSVTNRAEGLQRGAKLLEDTVNQAAADYSQFVWGLGDAA